MADSKDLATGLMGHSHQSSSGARRSRAAETQKYQEWQQRLAQLNKVFDVCARSGSRPEIAESHSSRQSEGHAAV